MEQVENPEIIELTKPKRGGRKPKITITSEPVPTQPAPMIAVEAPTPMTQVPVEEPKKKAVRAPRAKKEKVIEEAPPKSIVEVAQPQMRMDADFVKQNRGHHATDSSRLEEDPDYQLYMRLSNELAQQNIGVEPVSKPKKAPKKVAVPEQAPPKPEKAPRQKKVSKQEEEDDIFDRIDMIKSRITDTKIKKSRDENAFLRQKLEELEMELEDLRTPSKAPPTQSKARKQHTVKLPKERVEIIAHGAPEIPKQLPLRQIINSFGF
jgi:hypothetical protein